MSRYPRSPDELVWVPDKSGSGEFGIIDQIQPQERVYRVRRLFRVTRTKTLSMYLTEDAWWTFHGPIH